MLTDPRDIFHRVPENPLLDARDFPGIGRINNPAPAVHGDRIILLLSVLRFRTDCGGQTFVAESHDGLNFTIREKPFIDLKNERAPFDRIHYHTVDNRVTKIGGTHYIVTPVIPDTFEGPVSVLGKTTDFERYEPIEIINLPKNRGASLFPEKIGGKYVKLDRPGAGTGSHATMWLSTSENLTHWGEYRPLLQPDRDVFWTSTKIGPTPPIRTDHGWLEIYHGVATPSDGSHYYIGALLLDLEDPGRIVGRTYSYLLAPETEYERHGITDNVVFPCGVLPFPEKDELWLYYGAADTRVCLAKGALSQVVEACLNCQ